MDNQQQKTILIADDDRAILESSQLLLEMNNYRVITSTGNDVISLIKKYSPLVVLLDIWMGHIDGRDVCMQIRSDLTINKTPIIMVSASNDIQSTYLEDGANDYLEKPFDIDELLKKIENNIR